MKYANGQGKIFEKNGIKVQPAQPNVSDTGRARLGLNFFLKINKLSDLY